MFWQINNEDIFQQQTRDLMANAAQQPSSTAISKNGTTTATNDPAVTNLVFPSSMLSPKEETQEDFAKNATTKKAANGQQIQEEKISSTSQHSHELPPQFSLLAPVNMPVTVTSTEVLEMCMFKINKNFFD